MKKYLGITAAIAASVAVSGCATNPYGYNDPYYGNNNPQMGRAATGAAAGAVGGAIAGAVIPGLSVLEGAVIGAAVGGVTGAIWADRDNDGRVDGYVQNGQYYPGQPTTTQQPVYSEPARAGERG